jgi:hypothetical protein
LAGIIIFRLGWANAAVENKTAAAAVKTRFALCIMAPPGGSRPDSISIPGEFFGDNAPP